jgi:hypothetical protein
MPTDPPFMASRERIKRIEMLRSALSGLDSWVLSGSALGWGDFIRDELDLAIYLYVGPEERLKRIKARERQRYGFRIDEGGDMYKAHCAFVNWAMGYEGGDLSMRSLHSENEWLKPLACPILRIVGAKSLDEELKLAIDAIDEIVGSHSES